MSEPSPRELEATASAYEERLVPSLFRPWATRVARAADLRGARRVLDVACGTGVLARAVAETLGPDASVVGVDINPGMLRVAERVAPELEWREGSVEALPFGDAAFGAVVSQFGLMLFPDRRAAVREMVRVLKPGGSLTVAVFGSLASNPAYDALARAYERVVGRETADALRYPFSLGDPDELAALFRRSELTEPTLVGDAEVARFASVRDTVLADVEGWFPLAGIALGDDAIEAVIAEASGALEPFTAPGGAVAFPVAVHLVRAAKVGP